MPSRREMVGGLAGLAASATPLRRPMAAEGASTTIVDAHNHVIPQAVVDGFAADPEAFGVSVERRDGAPWLVHREGFAYPLSAGFTDPEAKVRALDRAGIDRAVVSPSPTLFFYGAEAARNAAFVRTLNEAVATFVRAAPGRLHGMGALPLQSPEASVAELDHLVNGLGLRAVMIGTHVNGVQLSAPQVRPVLRRAAELGVFVLTHPMYFGPKPGLEQYYLTNLIGNPLDTTVMAANLIFGGVLEELPALRIGLSHGGGFLPYQIGRLVHGWNVRRETQTTQASPKALLRRFYFDTIMHDAEALGYLVRTMGADRVLLGSDVPFDMADAGPVATLRAVRGLSQDDIALVAGRNALRIACA
ncbi:aminocarboxymuconate-semialdehyde decarboxylase [Methylobacterium sp. 174MFSha1.1]|uniref:amidohydrolase family protein n=1 Tax=Methylobacterium sp. 174MFSha1.1 TaxID=1502749 RepID=UPI0008E4BC00|nr:amidohydrolase family protein [Methylobacterium sp. 174MFSha1.1]SFV05417.1 aminocarboxymuconate-semialdehyde decarboxylase [Methylobacterium sp. 174MFSha1.1]